MGPGVIDVTGKREVIRVLKEGNKVIIESIESVTKNLEKDYREYRLDIKEIIFETYFVLKNN